MMTVSPDQDRVESQLAAGELSCPSCDGGKLGPWGWARPRQVGRGTRRRQVRPRRSRCRGCRATHVLLSVGMLLRRSDWVEVIGRALELKAAGVGQRPIAAKIGVPRSTVRGWLARFAEMAERLRAHFTRWALWEDVRLSRIEPAGSLLADAVAALVVAASATGAGCVWRFAAAATAGRLLCNTSSPFPAPFNR